MYYAGRQRSEQITLPDAIAQEAANALLLAPETTEAVLRQRRMRAERIERLPTPRAKLVAEPPDPMTPDEIQAEIEAYRHDVSTNKPPIGGLAGTTALPLPMLLQALQK
ncbi:MAG: hypothetical protein EPO25_04745 [Gammaproteobacteria bacterium]|nr:MAG: hypothetical protein EPO25_04745 [Gammaproteobacteria bacterium]